MNTRIVLLALALGACSAEEPPPPAAPAPQGRAETQSIRNTEAVGYGGNAVADKVDEALNKNDEQVKKAAQEPPE